jgi:ubiquinone biosynthesis monooxygenase Coq7
VTGLLGRRAIAATTVAVERVVLRHLDEQRAAMADDPAAVAAIDSIAAEETEHHDTSVQIMGAPTVALRALMAIVALSTEAVIWLGMNL